MKKQLSFLLLCSLLSSAFCADACQADDSIVRSDSGILCKLGEGQLLSFQYATPEKMRFVYNTERETYSAEPRVELVDALLAACKDPHALKMLHISPAVTFSTRILRALQTHTERSGAITQFATEIKTFLKKNPGSKEHGLAEGGELRVQIVQLKNKGVAPAQMLERIVDESQKTNADHLRSLGMKVVSKP